MKLLSDFSILKSEVFNMEHKEKNAPYKENKQKQLTANEITSYFQSFNILWNEMMISIFRIIQPP